MSHITKYKEKVTDIQAFIEVAALHGEVKTTETVQMFGAQKVKAVCQVMLPGWGYPIAVNAEGEIFYDHFGSSGADSFNRLGEMLQDYNEKATLKIIPHDLVTTHHVEALANGDRKLVMEYA